jgi:hypothetical protein
MEPRHIRVVEAYKIQTTLFAVRLEVRDPYDQTQVLIERFDMCSYRVRPNQGGPRDISRMGTREHDTNI